MTCPTLVIVGEEDAHVPRAVMPDIADAMPDARLVVIPDAGHSPQFENPPAWFAALEEFLAELLGGQVPGAFSRKRARSTMTRVMRPAATRPWPSLTDTRK